MSHEVVVVQSTGSTKWGWVTVLPSLNFVLKQACRQNADENIQVKFLHYVLPLYTSPTYSYLASNYQNIEETIYDMNTVAYMAQKPRDHINNYLL